MSDIGGFQEIIADGRSGRVAVFEDPVDWLHKLSELITAAADRSPAYENMRRQVIARVRECFDWEQLLDDLFAIEDSDPKPVEVESLMS